MDESINTPYSYAQTHSIQIPKIEQLINMDLIRTKRRILNLSAPRILRFKLLSTTRVLQTVHASPWFLCWLRIEGNEHNPISSMLISNQSHQQLAMCDTREPIPVFFFLINLKWHYCHYWHQSILASDELKFYNRSLISYTTTTV